MQYDLTEISQYMASTFQRRIALRATDSVIAPELPPDVHAAIQNIISMKSGKPVMPMVTLTLLAAKARYPALSVAAIQAGDVDFRTLYSKHLRRALVGVIDEMKITYRLTNDAFVSNPYREPLINQEWVEKRQQAEAADLLLLVSFVEEHPEVAGSLFARYVDTLLDHFEDGQVAYPIPSRITVAQVAEILEEFLIPSSGGSRMERAMIALLRFVGPAAGWNAVKGHATNDQLPYDAECFDGDTLQALAESKDQAIELIHLRQLVEEMRAVGVHRGFVFTRTKHLPKDLDEIKTYLRDQHLLGERVEVMDIIAAAGPWLVLADRGDADLPAFLQILADELDERASLDERQDFSRILREL
jgi:hypothetical protein